jgi:hypothetical protein
MKIPNEISQLIRNNDQAIDNIINDANKTWGNLKKLDILLRNRGSLKRKITREYITK